MHRESPEFTLLAQRSSLEETNKYLEVFLLLRAGPRSNFLHPYPLCAHDSLPVSISRSRDSRCSFHEISPTLAGPQFLVRLWRNESQPSRLTRIVSVFIIMEINVVSNQINYFKLPYISHTSIYDGRLMNDSCHVTTA